MMTLIRASMEVARCPSGLHLVTFDANMLSHPAFHGIAHDTLLISTCIPPKDWYFDDGIEVRARTLRWDVLKCWWDSCRINNQIDQGIPQQTCSGLRLSGLYAH